MAGKKPSYVVREVNGKDPVIAETIQAMHREVFGNSAPQVATWEGWWWVVYHGRAPAGFASLRTCGDEDTAYLHRAGVLPQHRRNGLQARLIAAREAKARALGFARLISDTTTNTGSANNLIRKGFRLFEPEFLWAWSYSLYWQKDLT